MPAPGLTGCQGGDGWSAASLELTSQVVVPFHDSRVSRVLCQCWRIRESLFQCFLASVVLGGWQKLISAPEHPPPPRCVAQGSKGSGHRWCRKGRSRASMVQRCRGARMQEGRPKHPSTKDAENLLNNGAKILFYSFIMKSRCRECL